MEEFSLIFWLYFCIDIIIDDNGIHNAISVAISFAILIGHLVWNDLLSGCNCQDSHTSLQPGWPPCHGNVAESDLEASRRVVQRGVAGAGWS